LLVEFDNQQFETPVPVTYEPLAYKIEPDAGPPVHAVPVAVQAETVPVDERVYPGAACVQTAAAERTKHPVTLATHEPAHYPTTLQVVGAVAIHWYPVMQDQHEPATDEAVGADITAAAVIAEAQPSPIVVDVKAPPLMA